MNLQSKNHNNVLNNADKSSSPKVDILLQIGCFSSMFFINKKLSNTKWIFSKLLNVWMYYTFDTNNYLERSMYSKKNFHVLKVF